jgi:hypothetical protein
MTRPNTDSRPSPIIDPWSDNRCHEPGPQPHNQIGTLREQLLLVHTPRPAPKQETRAELVELIEATVRRVLVEELPPAVAYLLKETTNVT